MNLTICRTICNELPGCNSPGSSLARLRWLMATDRSPQVRYVYVLAHLVHTAYREAVLDILQGETVLELPFDVTVYWQIPDEQSKVRYIMNINEARNFGIRYCQQHAADYVACLPADCYFPAAVLQRVQAVISHDQRTSPYRQYYGITVKECCMTETPEKFNSLPDTDLAILFRADAPRLFDIFRTFGDAESQDLWGFLGYTVEPPCVRQRRSSRAVTAGFCVRILPDMIAAATAGSKLQRQAAGVQQLVADVDALYPNLKLD